MAKAKVEEFKDANNEHRIRVTAANGKITYAISEGYKNRTDMVESAINSAIDLLENYESELTEKQQNRIKLFISKWIVKRL